MKFKYLNGFVQKNERCLILLAFLQLIWLCSYSQGSHFTPFKPEVNGFKFVNNFTNNFVDQAGIKLTTAGLCGGMSFSCVDYYLSGIQIPQQTYTPADHTPLYNYIYSREVNAIGGTIMKWVDVTFNPGGLRSDEFFAWGIRGSAGGQLQILKSLIDRDIPVPIALPIPGNGGACFGHVIVAFGYDFGRYRGDERAFVEDLRIYCYDCNYPGETITLVPDPRRHRFHYLEHSSEEYFTFFVENYQQNRPSVIDGPPSPSRSCYANELLITFNTGNDDLRGGADNCNVDIVFKDGSTQHFSNVNNGARWIDGKANTVSIRLNPQQPLQQFQQIRVFTKPCGGMSCDNWNLDGITVTARGGFDETQLLSASGHPLKRFTGNSYETRLDFPLLPPCN